MPLGFIDQSLHLSLREPMHQFPSFGRNVWLRVCMVDALHMDLDQTLMSASWNLVVQL